MEDQHTSRSIWDPQTSSIESGATVFRRTWGMVCAFELRLEYEVVVGRRMTRPFILGGLQSGQEEWHVAYNRHHPKSGGL